MVELPIVDMNKIFYILIGLIATFYTDATLCSATMCDKVFQAVEDTNKNNLLNISSYKLSNRSSDGIDHDELVMKIDLIRHADRAPVNSIEMNDQYWEQSVGYGNITTKGIADSLLYGFQLRELLKSFVNIQEPNDSIIVYSSGVKRATDTADFILQGLYNSKNSQLGVILFNRNLLLPRQVKLAKVALRKEMLKLNQELSEKLNINTGKNILDIADNQWSSFIHGIRDPYSELCLNDTIRYSEKLLAKKFDNKNYVKKKSENLLSYIISQFDLVEKSSEYKKYQMFVAHDSNILSALSALGVQQCTIIPYLSTLSFELYKVNNAEYCSAIIFNGSRIIINNSSYNALFKQCG